jgi:hypothetical protein
LVRASGELTPADAGEISRLIEAYVKAFETAELAERLERKDDLAMIARNVEARILKLEASASVRTRFWWLGEALAKKWRMPLRAQRSCAETVSFVRSGSVKASHHRRNGVKPATCAISILPNRIRFTDAWTGLWKPDETAVAPQIRAGPLHILLT